MSTGLKAFFKGKSDTGMNMTAGSTQRILAGVKRALPEKAEKSLENIKKSPQ